MPYPFLSPELQETADLAKKYFAKRGVSHFACEEKPKVDPTLPLRPTWQGNTSSHYYVYLDVRQLLRASKVADFVTKCATRGYPVLLWIVLPKNVGPSSLGKELKDARELGVGVARVIEDDTILEVHQPLALSLIALRCLSGRGALTKVQWVAVTDAERKFLAGNPDGACQDVGQQLEDVTRKFAAHSFALNWWNPNANPPNFDGNWGPLLERLEQDILPRQVQARCPDFKKQHVTTVRHLAGLRNAVSHPPKNAKERRERDEKLRTMFESMRDALVDWYAFARVLKLK